MNLPTYAIVCLSPTKYEVQTLKGNTVATFCTLADARLFKTAPYLLQVATASHGLFGSLLPLFEVVDSGADTNYKRGVEQILKTIENVLEAAGSNEKDDNGN